jgi:hypothetical protein
VWDLLAGGAALTPSSSVASALTEAFQTFSKTYDATSIAGHLGEPLTIAIQFTPRHNSAHLTGCRNQEVVVTHVEYT